MKNYEFIEHTADVGIRVKAASLEALFIDAAQAMFDIIAERKKPANAHREKIEIKQQADNREELFINWLNELLSLSAARGLVFCDFKISRLDDNSLEAVVFGEDAVNFKFNSEIKAATYHQLKLKEESGRWTAEVIFDV